VIIDNRPGAGGNIGTAFVARAKPDGYTLMINGNAQIINPSLYPKAGYAVNDFTPIATIAKSAMVVVANPAFPANNINDLIALAKKTPGGIFYATPGNGTGNHLAAVLFEQAAKVKFTPVHYKGAPAALNDVVAGQVPFTFATMASAQVFLAKDQLKVLAIATPERLAALPDARTLSESVPGYDFSAWNALFAPDGIPPKTLEVINRMVRQALKDPELIEAFRRQSQVPGTDTPEEFNTYVKGQTPRWEKVIQQANLRME